MADNLIPGFSLASEKLVEKDKKDETLVPGFTPVEESKEVEKQEAVTEETANVAAESQSSMGSTLENGLSEPNQDGDPEKKTKSGKKIIRSKKIEPFNMSGLFHETSLNYLKEQDANAISEILGIYNKKWFNPDGDNFIAEVYSQQITDEEKLIRPILKNR